jgi:heat shock protein HslJ
MKKIGIFSLIILVGFGCKKAAVNNADLLKVKWVLSDVQDTKTNAITKYANDAYSKISIEFTDSLNLVLFNGICNYGTGMYLYSSSTGAIQISDIIDSKIACKYDEWEGYTRQNLYTACNYKINGDNLVILETPATSLSLAGNN